jgi:hypothetical protein
MENEMVRIVCGVVAVAVLALIIMRRKKGQVE